MGSPRTDSKESSENKKPIIFGCEAVSKSGLCGMPEKHMRAMLEAAKQMHSPIMVRPVSNYAAYFLKHGYPTKSFMIKNKSSKKGVGAGLILDNPKYSHISPSEYAEHNQLIDLAFNKDKHHDGVLVKSPLILPQERIDELLNELGRAEIDETFQDPIIKKYTWPKDGESERVAAYAKPVEGKPGYFEFFEDPQCKTPIKVISENIINKEGEPEVKPISADYDLFAVLPEWSALHQRLNGDMKSEWAGLYDFAPMSELTAKYRIDDETGKETKYFSYEKGKMYIEVISPLINNDENSPIIHFSLGSGEVKIENQIIKSISQKELKEALGPTDFEKFLQGDDLITIMNKNKLKILENFSEQGHVEALRKAPIEMRPFRTQGNVKENKQAIVDANALAYVAEKNEKEYTGPLENQLQGNVNLRIQSAISIINASIASFDTMRQGTKGLEAVHHNDETHNAFASSLKDNMPILLFLPEGVDLGLKGQVKGEPMLVQSESDLQNIREKLSEAGFYWPTHARYKEDLPAFKISPQPEKESTKRIFSSLGISKNDFINEKENTKKEENTPIISTLTDSAPVNTITVESKSEVEKEQHEAPRFSNRG